MNQGKQCDADPFNLVPTGLAAAGFSVLLYKTTMRKVLSMEEARRLKEEAELKSRGNNP